MPGMRSLFSSSPHRVRKTNSRDSTEATKAENTKRRSFAFMKYSDPDRRSSASMKASREHARQIAMQLSMNEPEAAPLPPKRPSTRTPHTKPAATSHSTFQPTFPEPSAFDDFNPFGHDVTTASNSFSNHSAAKPAAPLPPQEDFFAQAESPFQQQAPKPANFQRKSSVNSNRSSTSSAAFPMRDNSFDNDNVSVTSSSAYDMDFLPIQSQQRAARSGRPPRNRGPSSEISFGSVSSTGWSQAQAPPLATVGSSSSKSMSTFPSNSSMQSTFATPAPTPPTKAVNMTPPLSSGGAAARRRMRSQLRHASSGASLQGSDTCSMDGTPPASPMSSRRNVMSSNGSVGSSNGGAGRNRVVSYTIGGTPASNWQHSPSPSMRGGASVCSSTAESDIDLFESNHETGGFTFDAFGLDASEIDREVQEAMQAINGSQNEFGGFTGGRKSVSSKPHETSMDDFAPQAWDSPPGSRRSTPTPKESAAGEEDFVDGFRVSKPSPLPLISVRGESPASSERSSSLSSITDHNADGAPRRNVFKEKAGFMSSNSANNGAPRRPRPSPVQPPKKKWVPPPGAVKMLTPRRQEMPTLKPTQPQQPKQNIEKDADNYWKEHLNQIPNMLKVEAAEEKPRQKATAKQQQTQNSFNTPAPNAAKKWQSAASKFSAPKSAPQPNRKVLRDSSFRKAQEEEKKADDASEDRDNQTDTTSAMTTESQTLSPRLSQTSLLQQQPPQTMQRLPQTESLNRHTGNLAKLETENPETEAEVPREKALSPQEQRKKELEELRNGGSPPSWGLKSEMPLQKSRHCTNDLKPQQERVNECSDQRTSIASLRQRLKSSPVEHEPQTKGFHSANSNGTPISSFHGALSPQSSDSKSEVGVSSFTRQKMKIASLSSSLASKSEVNYQRSPRNQSEVTAVLNRVRGMHSNRMSTPKSETAPNTGSAAPAFVGVKLRKTATPAALLPNRTGDEVEPQELQQQSLESLSYRERREMEPPKLQEQEDATRRGSPHRELQQSYSRDVPQHQRQHFHKEYSPEEAYSHADPQSEDMTEDMSSVGEESLRVPSPKKLSYRERRELELAKEREAKEQMEQEHKANEQPKLDVADLIRRRIAANKGKSTVSPTNGSQQQQPPQPDLFSIGRGRLRPTGRSMEEQMQVPISDDDFERRSIFAPGDELDADEEQYLASQHEEFSSLGVEEHPRLSPRHAIQSHLSEPSQHDEFSSSVAEEQPRLSPGHGIQSRPSESSVSPRHSIHSQGSSSSLRHSIHSQGSTSSPRHSQMQQAQQTQARRAETTVTFREQVEHSNTPPAKASAGGLATLHEQLKQKHNSVNQPKEEKPRAPSAATSGSSAGGLAALHAQLKQLKIQQSDEDASNDREQEAEAREEPKSAPRRIQALAEGKAGFEKLEVATTQSQASDQHSSPSRTPKATYAMLNAFLHGRDTVASVDETHAPKAEEKGEELSSPPGSPPKANHSSASAMVSDGRPALKDDPKYARYFTMLKIGMPMDVVKHAMIRDNLDPTVMDGDHSKPACLGIPLKDDPKYAKYFKMLKIGMPMEAVKHAMERDGLDSHIMDQDHNLPADDSKGKQDEGPKEKDSHRRARLHWKPQKVRRNSLWAQIDDDPELDNIEIDEEEFAELFQAELQPDGQKPKKGKRVSSPRKGAAVRVIDPKRANNGGIILARLKMSHDDMADVVDRIDENGMTAEQIEHIIEYLPTREERKALEAYMLEGGQDAAEKFDGLCECEKFMVSMMTVKHAKRKVRALLFKLQFETCLEALYQETHTVETSCDELSNSVRLRQLLGIVLTFGNRLNTAGKGKKKKAGAFTLDSLLKLNQAKAFDKKTTFLHYIVLIVLRNNELLLRFKDDLPTVLKADKVYWDQCISDLEEVENQLENVRRIALYQAKQAAKYRRKKKKHHDGDDDDESLTDMSLSLEEEVEALRATPIGLFTLSAIKKVSFLRDRVEGTKVKFNKVLEYFGEEEKHMQPHELFNIMVKFCRDFDKAKEQVSADEKKKKREERKRQNAVTNIQTPDKTPVKKPPQHSTGMLKASSMQPNASRLIDDMKRSSTVFSPPARQSHEETTPQTRNHAAQPRSDALTNQLPSHLQAHSHHQLSSPNYHAVQRRDSAPIEDSYRGPNAQDRTIHRMESAPIPSHETTRSAHDPSSRSQLLDDATQSALERSEAQGQPTRTPRHTSAQPITLAHEETNPITSSEQLGVPSHSLDLDEVIPRGMQDKGRLEVTPMDGGGDSRPISNLQGIDQSASSESQSSAALRRKARMRGSRRRTSTSPPEDPPAHTVPPTSRSTAPQMHRQSSAPIMGHALVAEHGAECRPSLPLENSMNVPQASSPHVPPAVSSSLMRNKLRNKRMLERRRVGRTSPPPNA